jgi:hypothetical protein
MKKITNNKGLIEGKERIKLYFEYDLEAIDLFSTMTLKDYALNSIRKYKSMVQEFLEYYRNLDRTKISEIHIFAGIFGRLSA